MNTPLKQYAAFFVAVFALGAPALAEAPPTTAAVTRNIVYKSIDPSTDALRNALSLDLYLPVKQPTVATLVWFHGGGMTGGDKKESVALAKVLAEHGITVASANYRLSPAAIYPAYVQDAAAAVAWVKRHGADFGAAGPVFVGGYSAGGYLACALGTDPRWLRSEGLQASELNGIVAISPQVFTHYTIRAERGIADPEHTPLIDEAAPVFHASAATPPVQLFIGDHDTPTRREEVGYFIAVLHLKQQADATLTLVRDRNHGTMHGNAAKPGDPVGTGIVAFIQHHLVATPATQPTTRRH